MYGQKEGFINIAGGQIFCSIALEHGLKHPEGLQGVILLSALVSVKGWLVDTAIRKSMYNEYKANVGVQ